MCFFIVERFHFQGHSCCNYCNPYRYTMLRNQRSVAFEVMNTVLHRSAGFIRYIRGDNIATYLRIMFALHNFTSMLKDRLNRRELPILNYGDLFNEHYSGCNCEYCISLTKAFIWNHCTKKPVTSLLIHSQITSRNKKSTSFASSSNDSSVYEQDQESSAGRAEAGTTSHSEGYLSS